MPQAFIPVAKGLDQKLDERLRSPDSLSTLTNAYYKRNNAVTKRNGFTALTTTIRGIDNTAETGGLCNQGVAKGLFSTGDELCVRGYRSLYAYDPGDANYSPVWYNRGDVAPFTGEQRTVFTGFQNVATSDCATVRGDVVQAATVVNVYPDTGATQRYSTALVFQVDGEDGITRVPLGTIASNNNVVYSTYDITGVRVVNANHIPSMGAQGGHAYIGVQRWDGIASTATLEWYLWDRLFPTTPPNLQFSDTDLWVDTVTPTGQMRRYDAAEIVSSGLNNGYWCYAYIAVVPNPAGGMMSAIKARIKNAAATIATVTIPPPAGGQWRAVSIHYGTDSGQIYIVAHERATGGLGVGAGTCYLYRLNGTTLAVIGFVTIDTLPGGASLSDYFYSVGVAEGTDYLGNTSVCAVWSTESATIYGTPTTRACAYTTALAIPAGEAKQINYAMHLVSKPWFQAGRAYVTGRNYYAWEITNATTDSNWFEDGYNAEAIVDLRILEPSTIADGKAKLVGRYNFGVTPTYRELQPYTRFEPSGSLQQVQKSGTRWRYAVERIVSKASATEVTCGGDVLDLDYAGKVTQRATTNGTATTGGGNVGWYDGQRAEELGFVSAPGIFSFADVSTANGTLVNNTTYQWMAVFETYDEKGSLIRSLPCKPVKHKITGMHNSCEVTVWSLNPTQRYGRKRFGVAIYRDNADGVFRRVKPPLYNTLDQWGSPTFLKLIDTGEQFDVVYTQSGAELEAAGPDGASLVATTAKRVWLGGFFRADRVQYSKLYNPATANEYSLAPEFNDAFSYLIPGGEACTGLAELDDKVIIFTKSKIYAIAGNGPDDGGRGNDFSGLQLISTDAGCIEPRSVASFPGGLMFQAPSGLFVLGRDFQVSFIGAAVRDMTDALNEVTSAVPVPAANHIRFTVRNGSGSSAILIYDLDQGAWFRWEPKRNVGMETAAIDIIGAALHQNVYYILGANGVVYKEDASAYKDDGTIYVPMTVETSWLQGADQSGWQRVRKVASLCKRNDPHDLTMSLYQDFSAAPSQSFTWDATAISNQKLQELVEMRASVQKCTAFKIKITDAAATGTITGQGYECAGFTVELGGKRGLYKPGEQQRN